MEISKKEFLKLPVSPGVYIFYAKNTPIYIGKAINLKNRLNSYLSKNLLPKTKKMVASANYVEYILVNSEIESLLLEAELIKKYKPKYNIVLKDDKNPLYIVITKDEFPRILTVRKLLTFDYRLATVYGPFPNSSEVKKILKIIRKIVPFSDHKLGKKPCIYSHLGLCSPCPSAVARIKNYELRIMNLKRYTQNIKKIKQILSRKFSFVRNQLVKEMKTLSKQNKFEEALVIREKIKTLDYITQVKSNIKWYLENPNLIEDIRSQELRELKKILSTYCRIHNTNLVRIECFDIAHLAGLHPTASMVVFENGQELKSAYRHFKIRQKKSNSDYDSMKEVAIRRVKNLENWGRPDLIIVDGGYGQVKLFDNEFKRYNIPVIGIAKNPDRIVFPNGNKLKLQGPAQLFLERIRDEAHRFARRLHHKLINKYLTLDS
jgi:excinuclease ABC subunit C